MQAHETEGAFFSDFEASGYTLHAKVQVDPATSAGQTYGTTTQTQTLGEMERKKSIPLVTPETSKFYAACIGASGSQVAGSPMQLKIADGLLASQAMGVKSFNLAKIWQNAT